MPVAFISTVTVKDFDPEEENEFEKENASYSIPLPVRMLLNGTAILFS